MKWFCTNCCGIVADGILGSWSSTACPHCHVSESGNLSGNASWARDKADQIGVTCTLAVSQPDHKDLKSSGFGMVDNGSCAAIVAVWISCYHGKMNNRAEALTDFIRLCSADVDQISARQIQMAGKSSTIVQAKALIPDLRFKFELARKTIEIQTQNIMKRAAVSPSEARGFVDRMKLDLQEHAQNLRGMQQTALRADQQRDFTLSGNIGVHQNRDYTRLQLDTAMDYMLGRAGYYSVSINSPGGDGHRIGFITAANKFMFLDPNTGEFRTKSRGKLKTVVNAHFTALYSAYTNDIKVLVTL